MASVKSAIARSQFEFTPIGAAAAVKRRVERLVEADRLAVVGDGPVVLALAVEGIGARDVVGSGIGIELDGGVIVRDGAVVFLLVAPGVATSS